MANGDVITVGGKLTATATTTLTSTSAFYELLALHAYGDGPALRAESKGGIAIRGASGASIGVVGGSTQYAGVSGSGKYGVLGYGQSAGVIGRSQYGSGSGVIGHTGGDLLPPVTPAKTGVYGHSVIDAASRGVWGHSEAGRGVVGDATSGTGVVAAATTGYALATSGRLRFDRVSGVATIPAGATEVVVTPGIDVTSNSFVLLTPRANIGSRGLWFETDAASDSFTIRLSTSRGSATPVSWLLVESVPERASF